MSLRIIFYSNTYNLSGEIMINYLKSVAWTAGVILISTIIITLLNYFNILNGTPLKIIHLIIPLVAVFIGSYKLGKTCNTKGYIEGLKYGILWIIVLIISNLLTKSLTWITSIYMIILILLSMFSSILGINRKKK